MRNLKLIWLLLLTCAMTVSAWAQDVRIIYPQEGQDVRGEVTVRFEGIPQGGYALVNIDGVFKQATAQEFLVLDTIADRATFARGDAPYKLDITVLSPGGGRVGTASVTFSVANSKVAEGAESVRLAHWTSKDIYDKDVFRYRVFAESNATIEEGGANSTSGRGSAAGADAGAGGAEVSYIPSPLDWQVSALMRSMMRDINTYDGSANIATIVQESFERQRNSESGKGAGGVDVTPKSSRRRRGTQVMSGPVKAPWKDIWTKAPETGNRFVKMIRQDGTEINATRKAPTVALADLLPTFPKASVRPGSTWETTMSILGDLSSREGINVQAPITFTAYETLITPGGESRRTAKLESRFRLPDNLAKKIAANLGNKVGTGAGVGGAGAAGGAAGGGTGLTASGVGAGATDALLPEDIDVARTDVARVIWFDMDRRRVLRAEDRINSYFEIPPASEGTGQAATGNPEVGADTVVSQPSKISYNMNVTTWQDDRIPDPTDNFTNGAGTAHARDNVVDVTLAKIKKQQ